MRDPRFPFSPFCFRKSAASWKPTGPGGLAGTRARAGSGNDDRKEGDPQGGDGVCRRRSLATPCPPVRLARTLPNHLCPKARELREAVGSGSDSVCPFGLEKEILGSSHLEATLVSNPWIPSPPPPPPPKKSLCAPDVSRARGDTRSLLFAPPSIKAGVGGKRVGPAREAPGSLQSCAPLTPAAVRAFARQRPAPLHAPRAARPSSPSRARDAGAERGCDAPPGPGSQEQC